MDLGGKIAVITGASGGLGQALARAFARSNARVVLASRDLGRLQKIAEQIRNDGGQAWALACDVAQRDAVEALHERTREQVGTAQILVNNAGVARAARFLDMTDEVWNEAFQVNVTGAYYCCKAFLPEMIASRWGRILNIASITAKAAYSHVAAYTSSKHALLGLTRSLALETARHGVTVNAICPGYLDTELTRDNAAVMAAATGQTVDAVLRMFASSSPQRRLIAPEEVAELALLLASDRAGGITGQAINVDGGALMA